MEALGVVINNVDRDGTMKEYDEDIIKDIAQAVNIPIMALRGAGSFEDIRNIIINTGVLSAAAGSLFVYYSKLKAVLINYSSQAKLEKLFKGGS